MKINLRPSGIFLESNFKYQNAHNIEFGGAISAKYGGFSLYHVYYLTLSGGGIAPWYLVQWAISNFRGLRPRKKISCVQVSLPTLIFCPTLKMLNFF